MYWRRFVALTSAGLVAIAAAVGAVAFFQLLRHSDVKSYGVFLAAFLGAFFSFLFVRLGEALTIIYRRKEKHLGALVVLEHRLNYLLAVVEDDIWLADGFLKTVSTGVGPRGEIRSSGNRLSSLPIDVDLPTDLTNLDLMNELLRFNVHLGKMNESIDSIARQYDGILGAVQRRPATPDDIAVYQINVQHVREGMNIVRQHLRAIQTEAVDILAKTRLLGRSSTLLGWFMRNVTQMHYPRGFERQVDEERRKVSGELESSRQQSRERIAALERGEVTPASNSHNQASQPRPGEGATER